MPTPEIIIPLASPLNRLTTVGACISPTKSSLQCEMLEEAPESHITWKEPLSGIAFRSRDDAICYIMSINELAKESCGIERIRGTASEERASDPKLNNEIEFVQDD